MTTATGHVQLIDRKRGPQFYLKYRLPSGRQVQKRLGPAWTERSRPPAGYFTRKTAQAALDALLTDARRGEIPDPGDSSGKTFGDAVAEWLRYCGDERGLGETTMRDYRNTAHNTLCVEFDPDTLARLDRRGHDRWPTDPRRCRASWRSGGSVPKSNARCRAAPLRSGSYMLGGIFKRAKRLKWVHVDPTDRHRGNHAEGVWRLQRPHHRAGRGHRSEGGRRPRSGRSGHVPAPRSSLPP